MTKDELINELQKLPSSTSNLDVVIYNEESECLIDDYFHIREVYYDDNGQFNHKIYLKK